MRGKRTLQAASTRATDVEEDGKVAVIVHMSGTNANDAGDVLGLKRCSFLGSMNVDLGNSCRVGVVDGCGALGSRIADGDPGAGKGGESLGEMHLAWMK